MCLVYKLDKYKLDKSLYGLKQASRCWSKRFVKFLKRFGFKPCKSDPSVFIAYIKGIRVIFATWVDDGLMMAKFRWIIDFLIAELEKEFEISVSDPNTFVGVQIERDRANRTMFISQSVYANSVIERFNMSDSKCLSTLTELGVNLR